MLGKREATGRFMLTMIFALSLALPGAAAELQRSMTPIAHLDVAPLRIDWLPVVAHERLVLTISGPGDLFIRRVFEGGRSPSLGLFDSEGDRLPDGNYNWELRWVETSKAREASEQDDSKKLRVAGKPPEQPLVLAGHFFVRNGSFVAAPANTAAHPPKPPASTIMAKNFVETGTLVVQRNACIGDQCATNDANFSALKLKSTLPNIRFDDVDIPCEDPPCVSTAHDWELLINPSDVAQFSVRDVDGDLIPFTVTAGAPDNSLYVGGNGNVGLGTSTPAVRLDVQANATGQAAARLQNSSSSGYSGTEYLDNAGNVDLFFGIDNAAATTRFNSINNVPIVILTNSTERMRFTSGGSIGIGTASPDNKLDIRCNAAAATCGKIFNSSATGFSGWEFAEEGGTVVANVSVDNANNNFRMNANNNFPIVFLTNSTEHVRLDSDGDVGINCNNPTSDLVIASGSGCSTPSSSINAGSTQFTASSSRTFKENLSPVLVPGILDKIAKVDVFTYDFIKGPKDRLGLMAEDFHEIFGRGSDKMIDGQEVEMALWLAVKELTAQNQQLSKRLTELEASLETERANRH